ncbi:MAG: cytochrome c oxidase subunit 3 [Acidobacteria bacterium]|nr:cytochrome c oxidase subunit 3 [Acidobacteriota bacterium]
MTVATKQRSVWKPAELERIEPGQVAVAGDGEIAREGSLSMNTAELGLWIFLSTVTMLFAGFTSAYLVREAGSDWRPIPVPPVLWLNSGLLLLSSFAIEMARARQRRMEAGRYNGWLAGTTLLGTAFLAGQLLAWRQLAAEGLYLPSNSHSAFFYVLTGVHGLHLLGGIGALLYALIAIRRPAPPPAAIQHLKLCATYWHFVGGLWLYLLLVLFVF